MSLSTEHGYFPFNLKDAFNCPVTVFEDPEEVTLGDRILHGIPFEFGVPDSAVLRADPGRSIDVEVDKTSTWLIFAHALLETDLYEGGEIGEPVGSYSITHDDGEVTEVPLLQRFEIGPTPRKWNGHAIPLDWGQTPFLAVNDAEHVLMDRVCGRYDEAGARLVEIEDPQSRVPYVLPYRFYLWAWKNPRPEIPIRSLTVHGGQSHTIVLGAMTRSTLDENPLNRHVARELIIRLPHHEVSEDITATVDRGLARYIYRTNHNDAQPRTDTIGWGRDNGDPHRGYVNISAAQSATVTISVAGTAIGQFKWGELVDRGRLDVNDDLIVELPAADQTWVTGEVRDAETKKPIACRLRFESPNGIPYAPYGHHAHINSDAGTWNLDIGGDVRLGTSTYAFVDGRFEGWLPNGSVTVETARGFTYEPMSTTIDVAPDNSHLVIDLHRAFDPSIRNYVGGDTHVHFVSTKGGELEARSEDLQIVNLLQTQWGQLFTSTEEFTGTPEYSADHGTVVFAGQENRTNMLGHINLLGLREPIMPWCTGGSEEAELGGGLETTLSRWADECHAQGGTVVLAHFPVPYGETAALLATGRLDAVETIAFDDYNMNEYYRYLNAGFQIPLAAGTDKMTAEVPVGLMRTYAGVESNTVDYWEWSQGIKRGDTTVTSGPLLWLHVNGKRPGGTVAIAPGETVTVNGELESVFPVAEIEVVINGEITKRISIPFGSRSFTFEVDTTPSRDMWIALRCFGADNAHHHDTWNRQVFAHTSPVYVTISENYCLFDADTIRHLLRIVDGARRYITERSRTEWAGVTTHRHGGSDHIEFLVEPFDEATHALTTILEYGAQQ